MKIVRLASAAIGLFFILLYSQSALAWFHFCAVVPAVFPPPPQQLPVPTLICEFEWAPPDGSVFNAFQEVTNITKFPNVLVFSRTDLIAMLGPNHFGVHIHGLACPTPAENYLIKGKVTAFHKAGGITISNRSAIITYLDDAC